MPNVPPANVTITDTTGPGLASVATVFSNVVELNVDFKANTIMINHAGGLTKSYYSYSAVATLTWTITGGLTAIVIST